MTTTTIDALMAASRDPETRWRLALAADAKDDRQVARHLSDASAAARRAGEVDLGMAIRDARDALVRRIAETTAPDVADSPELAPRASMRGKWRTVRTTGWTAPVAAEDSPRRNARADGGVVHHQVRRCSDLGCRWYYEYRQVAANCGSREYGEPYEAADQQRAAQEWATARA